MTRLHLVCIALIAAGCTPTLDNNRDPLQPELMEATFDNRYESTGPTRDIEGSAGLAVVALDQNYMAEIWVLDASGDVVQTIETDVYGASRAAMHPDGWLVLAGSGALYAVDLEDGWVDPLGAINSDYMWNVTVDDEGNVDVADEYDVISHDPETGETEVLASTSSRCFTDVAVGPDGELIATDIYGPSLVQVEGGTASDTMQWSLGGTPDLIAFDDSGALWAASVTGGIVRDTGTLDTMFVDLPGTYLYGMDSAGNDSVWAVTDSSVGSALVRIHADGTVDVVQEFTGSLLYDVVSLR